MHTHNLQAMIEAKFTHTHIYVQRHQICMDVINQTEGTLKITQTRRNDDKSNKAFFHDNKYVRLNWKLSNLIWDRYQQCINEQSFTHKI